MFISFEGTEGSGKSTQIELLRTALAGRDPLVVREPGGTPLGERVRELLLHGGDMAPDAEMHLFMAARSELLDRVVRPALDAGRLVIADRYHDSTLAYQGGGRGATTFWPASYPKPDRTFLLLVPIELGLTRQRARSRADRIESEPAGFHRAVAAAYQRLAAEEPRRWVRLDATQAPAAIHSQIMEALEELMPV